MDTEKFPHRIAHRATVLALGLIGCCIAACDAPDPSRDTPTSGRLIVFVDETYAPLIQTLADSFVQKVGTARIEVRAGSARSMVQAYLDAQFIDSTSRDTGATTALIVGRELFADEQKAFAQPDWVLKRYELGWDGIAVVVPSTTPMRYTMVDRLKKGLSSKTPPPDVLDSGVQIQPMRWLATDQNSSTLSVIKTRLTGDSDIVAPTRYFTTSDSVVQAVVEGQGVGLVSWFATRRDSARIKTVAVGFQDSLGFAHNPTRVHPTTLVTGAYPMKQPLVGLALAPERSLAIGFLAWLSRSEDAQYFIARTGGLQPAVKMRLVLPE